MADHRSKAITSRVRFDVFQLLWRAAPAADIEALLLHRERDFPANLTKAENAHRRVGGERRRNVDPAAIAGLLLEYVKPPVVAVNRSLCVVNHRSRERRIDKARQRYSFREALRIQLICAGAKRKYGPQNYQALETAVRKRPDHGNVYAFRTINLIAHRELEFVELAGNGLEPFTQGNHIALEIKGRLNFRDGGGN